MAEIKVFISSVQSEFAQERKQLCELPAPKFVQEEEDFNTIIYRNVVENVVENVMVNVLESKYKKLTDRQRLILSKMQAGATHDVIENVLENVVENVIVNVVENAFTLADHLHVTPRTIQRDLNILQTEGFLRHEGPDKGGKWVIINF